MNLVGVKTIVYVMICACLHCRMKFAVAVVCLLMLTVLVSVCGNCRLHCHSLYLFAGWGLSPNNQCDINLPFHFLYHLVGLPLFYSRLRFPFVNSHIAHCACAMWRDLVVGLWYKNSHIFKIPDPNLPIHYDVFWCSFLARCFSVFIVSCFIILLPCA